MENLLSQPSSVKLVETNPGQCSHQDFFKGIVGVGWGWGQGNGKMIEGHRREENDSERR